MVYPLMLVDILDVINQQDTPSFLPEVDLRIVVENLERKLKIAWDEKFNGS